jgi:hypothetical protein
MASDPDNGPQPLTFTWTVTGAEPVVVSKTVAGLQLTCTPGQFYTATVIVSDGDSTPGCAKTGRFSTICSDVSDSCSTFAGIHSSNQACLGCEVNNCGLGVVNQCSGGAGTTICATILDCVRRTNCAAQSLDDCVCGAGDHAACAAGHPEAMLGQCLDPIRAGLPGVADDQLLSQLTGSSTQTSLALDLIACDEKSCSSVCFPYCQ